MQPFHAVVKNGRLTLDAPSDLPDGEVVVLLPLEELLGLVDEQDGGGAVPMTFTIGAPREFRKPKPVDAAAILDELRSM